MKKYSCKWLDYSHFFKALLIMKTIILIVMIATVQVQASKSYAQLTRVNLNYVNTSVEHVLDAIENQSEFYFLYNEKLIDAQRKVTIRAENQHIDDILNQLFANTGIDFSVTNRKIVLAPADINEVVQQQHRVSGIITDESGLTLPGATVTIKGTLLGTITDAEGKYILNNVPADATLVFSFVGMRMHEEPINGRNLIDITLKADALGLEEVVVVGYGTQRKRDITGAVSSVSATDAGNVPVAGIDQALQGQVAGVMVTQDYGAPGANIQVRIRGIGTIGDSDPLYVIDGVPTKEFVNSLNTNDIESISILKDASAAAIYGARAANGVVLITTKKGHKGITRVGFNSQYGIQQVTNKLNLLNASQYAQISDEALVNDGKSPVWNQSVSGAGTDWQDAIFRNAAFQRHDLSIASGSENTTYLIGIGYFSNDGVVKHSDFSRYNIRLNLDATVTPRFHAGTNLNLARLDQNLIDTEINGVVRAAIFQPPTIPVYNADGSFAGPGPNEGDAQNPLGMAERSFRRSLSNQIFGNIYAEYKALPTLVFRTSLGLNSYARQIKDFDPTFAEGNANRNINSLTQQQDIYMDVIWENTFTYTTSINDIHQITALAGNTLQSVKTDGLFGYREGFTYNEPYLQYLDAGSSNDRTRGNLTEWALASFYGRANYGYDNKYLFAANIRYDGSSRFGEINRWGLFPSASIGWRMSEETFFNIPIIDDLKWRASWGQLGNQDIGLYAFSSLLSQTFYALGSGQALQRGYAPANDFNPDVKWETTTQQNFGLDIYALNYRLFLTADYYIKTTTDMLLMLPQPMTSGFGTTGYENLGEVENKGLELHATWRNTIGEFNYSLSGNIATLNNKVLSLGALNEPITSGLFFDLSTRTQVGRSIREFYGYVTDGVFQNQAEIDAHASQPGAKPGDIRFKDLNNDKLIDSEDRTFIGNPYPDFYYGFNTSLAYKSIDISLFFQGQHGNQIFNATKFWLTNSGYNYNKGTQILERWTGPDSSNTEPRLTTNDPNQNARASDRYIEDGSYLRLKNLQVGYTLPASLAVKVGISKARIYFSGYNLLTLTGYTGYDPEVGVARSTLGDRTIGFDEVTYPQNKSYLIGLSVTF